MNFKVFLIQNKQKILMGIGVAAIVIAIFGLGFSILKKEPTVEGEAFTEGTETASEVEMESSKLHLLCLGVDKYEVMSEREKRANSIGQSDGIFLITIDEETKYVDIVAVPRDTIVTIQKYNSNMQYLGAEEAQICLQYAYADGVENSCELIVDRVEELFEGIEIDGYVSINLASVEEINNVIGGVTVQVNNADTAQKMGVEIGSSVHLDQENIVLYLQSRDVEAAQSAHGRMDRLRDYVNAFIPQALEELKKKPTLVTDLISVLGENMVTDLNVVDIAYLTTLITGVSPENITYQILEGEIVVGEDGYEEFYPDSLKLEQIIEKIK